MSEFLASVLAKAGMMLLEMLIARIIQALITSLPARTGLRMA
ncbi:hypothetical protein ACIBO2_09145 [Nonomuraea sp. NPDC050022]